MNPARSLSVVALGLSTLACGGADAPVITAPRPPTPSAAPTASAAPALVDAIAQLRAEAKKLDAIVTTKEVKRFLALVPTLPHIAPRTFDHDEKKHYSTEQQAAAVPPAVKAALKTKIADEDYSSGGATIPRTSGISITISR